jgi:hypothetical protein
MHSFLPYNSTFGLTEKKIEKEITPVSPIGVVLNGSESLEKLRYHLRHPISAEPL